MGTPAITPTLHTSTCDTGTAGTGSTTQPDGGETHILTPFQNPRTSSSPGLDPWSGWVPCQGTAAGLGVSVVPGPYVSMSTRRRAGGGPGVWPRLGRRLSGRAASLEREGETRAPRGRSEEPGRAMREA